MGKFRFRSAPIDRYNASNASKVYLKVPIRGTYVLVDGCDFTPFKKTGTKKREV
jgi:hypothetical protein